MTEQTPNPAAGGHRTGSETRSGDTHVIGADGAAVNVDQQARDAVEAEQVKAAKRSAGGRAADETKPAA